MSEPIPSTQTQHVVVIGAGAIGLTSTRELALAGLRVTLLERDDVGAGCSAGNAGWVVPSISLPIAAPGLRTQGFRWLLQPDSPLYVKPSALPGLAPWLWQFWRHCTAEAFERAAEVLTAFAGDALALYQELVDECPGIEWRQHGLLMAFRTEDALAGERSLLERYGYAVGSGRVQVVDSEELAALEPALGPGSWVGALHILPESHVEPATLTEALAARCRALGVDIRAGCRVERLRFAPGSRQVVAASASGGGQTFEIEADHFVIATGAEAGRLAAACGTRIPLQAGKGYSITLDEPETRVRHPLYLAEARIGVSPFGNALRIAGTLELSGINTRLDRRRLAGFERAAEGAIPGLTHGGGRREWVGMRPLTPDGLPVIGRLPTADNVWMNTAHQMLGITLAPASGRLLAAQLLGRVRDEDAGFDRAFAPARFSRAAAAARRPGHS